MTKWSQRGLSKPHTSPTRISWSDTSDLFNASQTMRPSAVKVTVVSYDRVATVNRHVRHSESVEAKFHTFLISVLGGIGPASRSFLFASGDGYVVNRCTRGWCVPGTVWTLASCQELKPGHLARSHGRVLVRLHVFSISTLAGEWSAWGSGHSVPCSLPVKRTQEPVRTWCVI
jgi:hypothetical protein